MIRLLKRLVMVWTLLIRSNNMAARKERILLYTDEKTVYLLNKEVKEKRTSRNELINTILREHFETEGTWNEKEVK